MAKVCISGIVWTNEPVFFNELPKKVTLEIDEDLVCDDTMEEYLLYALSEEYMFIPVSIGGYKILNSH